MATPLASKTTLVAPSVPALAASVAVKPATRVKGVLQGLALPPQAVTVTVLAWQLRPLVGSANS